MTMIRPLTLPSIIVVGALMNPFAARAQRTYMVTESAYIATHPTGGCNAILMRAANRFQRQDAGTVKKYLFSRWCAFRDPGFKPWEQEFSGVQEVQGSDVIYIPAQKMIDGRTFPGNYWCSHAIVDVRKWRAGKCTKNGWVGTR